MSDPLQLRDEAWKRERWEQYYAVTVGRPPRETLTFALDRFAAESGGNELGTNEGAGVERRDRADRRSLRAIDLGCGAGNDVLEMLRRGWSVVANDEQAESFFRLREQVPAADQTRLEIRIGRFAAIEIPPVDLVNASYCLPFAPRSEFEMVWPRIVAALPPGGRFAGHFFGPRDSWAANPDLTIHSIEAVRGLLDAFEIEHFHERNEDGETALGESKHWHVFEVVARKK